MQGCHILLLILLAAAIIAGGCTTPEEAGETQPASPTLSPAPTEVQAVGAGLPAPTPAAPVRGDKTPQSVGFVDPRTYHIPTPTPTTTMTKPPNDLQVSGKMVAYATVTCDHPPGVLATEVYHVPFPYWDLNVSATPMNEYPWLVIEVRDPEDPNRVIRKIQYSRSDILHSGNSSTGDATKKQETFTIREGYGDYYFTIRSGSLKSLELTILIPEKYLV